MKMKSFLFFFCLILFIKSQEKYQLSSVKYYPKSNTIEYNGQKYILSSTEEQTELDFSIHLNFSFWTNLILFLIFACFAGLINGLTFCYSSIDNFIFEKKLEGTEIEKNYAQKINGIVSYYHWLLVTLLLCNAFASQTMPIILSKKVSQSTAIVLCAITLLIVGKLIPNKIFTGPNQLKIGAFFVPFTRFLMKITSSISYRYASFLDNNIGKKEPNYINNEDFLNVNPLYFKMLSNISGKKIGELIIPIEKVTKLDYQIKLTKEELTRLIESGYWRIPVFKKNPNNLVGILRLKELVGKDLSKPKTLEQLKMNLTVPIRVYDDIPLFDLFQKFCAGRSHIAFIYTNEKTSLNFENENLPPEENESNKKIIGIITLEDLIEFMMKK